jgi:uncharacterized protein (DUF1697 family)
VTRYVAFLRAINITGRRLAMERLRAEVESLGYDDVVTYIASGNVLFTTSTKAADAEQAIEAHLGKALGYDVETFVRSAAQVRAVVERRPFAQVGDGDSHFVGFLQRKPTAAERTAIEALTGEADQLAVHGKELHWLIHGKMMDSQIKPRAMDRAVAQPITTRNITVLRKLAERL